MDESNNKICEEFKTEFWLYLEKALPKERTGSWDSHLKNCKRCSKLMRDSIKTIELYNNISLEDLSDSTFEKIIHNVTKVKRQSDIKVGIRKNKSLAEIFGFYKLTIGVALVAAAIIFLIITFIKDPKLPEIKTDLPKQILEWNDNQMDNRLEKVSDHIYSLRTDDWDIYLIRRNKKENWNKALSSIQKQIRKMQKEVASATM